VEVLQASIVLEQQKVQNIKVLPIMISLMLAAFIGMFNETALNMALSDLIREFNISESTVQWLTTGYLLTLGILLPLSGLLIQWFTARQLFLTAVSFSVVGSAIGAMAGNFDILLIARIFQATGAGLLFPLMFNTVLIIFPAEKRGSAMGLVTLVFTAAPAVGPTVSGLLIAKLSWHWIFWLSLLFLLIALVFGARYMKNVSTITKPRIDLFSLLMSTLGFGGVVFGISSVGESEYGWNDSKVIVSVIVGIVSAMLVLPMYLIRGLGMSSLTAGLILLPGSLILAILSPVIGMLFDKFGPKWLVIPGLLIAVGALCFFSGITIASTIGLIVILHCCLMIGIVMVWMPAQTNGLNQLSPEMYPDGTAIVNSLQQVAGAIGMAVSVSVMTTGATDFMKDVPVPSDPVNASLALTAGIQNAFLFAMFVAVAGLIIGLFIKRVKVAKWTQKHGGH
jgi:DHA2 family lincomycin resistance protein-like MFS transporter